MIQAGIFGATGYTGYELVTILGRHPHVEIAFATSESSAGKSLADLYPQAPDLPLVASAGADLSTVDVAFLCLPHAAAAPTAVRCLEAGVRVVDLSADFRLNDVDVYEKWYKVTHPAPQLLDEAVYGLTEFARDQLPTARLVACPGCYPTTVLLGMAPVLKAGLVNGTVIADSKSGVTGAGRKGKVAYHLAELGENFYPYSVGQAHRHQPEMVQGMQMFDPLAPDLIFSPHLLPVARGIVSTIYVPLSEAVDLDRVSALYQEMYAGEPFVKVLPLGGMATLAHVVRTNRCVISLHDGGDRLIVVSCEDNLVKGSGGQAVQNMNVMFGCEETMGLL